MPSKRDAMTARALALVGCGYIYGATGWICTRARMEQQMRQYPTYAGQIERYGKKWLGKPCYDCAQLTRDVARRAGVRLHQLRGRIGRGSAKSYCILVSDAKGDTARQRLLTMKKYSDGFKIADEDLRLRGPGDFFGKRQHGLPELRLADMVEDMDTLRLCRDCADTILADDPNLDKPKNQPLLTETQDLFRRSTT